MPKVSAMPNPAATLARRQTATRIGTLLLAIVVLAGAWLVWKEILGPRLIPKRFGTVIEHSLYRSGRIHPSLLPKVVDQYGIDDIVSLTYPPRSPDYQQLEHDLGTAHRVRLHRFPLQGDGTGDPANVVAAVIAIHEAIARGDQVLVQCAAGSERTGGVVYLYRTLVLGQSADAAYAELLRYGHRPARNPKLEAFLNANMTYFANALSAQGIPRPDATPLPRLPEPRPA